MLRLPTMAQSKARSFKEAWANIFVGYGFNYAMNLAFLPVLWDPENPLLSAHKIGVVFTAASLVRSYIIRRWFNKKD